MKQLYLFLIIVSLLSHHALAGVDPSVSQKALSLALENFMAGKEQFYELNLDKAIGHLNKANDLYKNNMASLTNGNNLYDSHIFLSLCYFTKNKLEEAKVEIKNAYQLNPKRKISDKEYAPRYVVFFKKTLKKIQSKKLKAKLEIHSSPSFAKILVNGFEVGMTPLIMNDWVSGEHHIRILHKNHKDWIKRVHVSQNANSRLDARLIPLESEKWLIHKPLTQKINTSNLEAQKFIDALSSKSEKQTSTGFWIWPLTAVAVGGITYAILQNTKKDNKPTEVGVSLIRARLP